MSYGSWCPVGGIWSLEYTGVGTVRLLSVSVMLITANRCHVYLRDVYPGRGHRKDGSVQHSCKCSCACGQPPSNFHIMTCWRLHPILLQVLRDLQGPLRDSPRKLSMVDGHFFLTSLLYQEQITDLLEPGSSNLQIREERAETLEFEFSVVLSFFSSSFRSLALLISWIKHVYRMFVCFARTSIVVST